MKFKDYYIKEQLKYQPVTKEIEKQIKNNSVYHVTSKENAENILKHNYFRPSRGTIELLGLSTTIDPDYNWGGGKVKFVLDYNKLKNDYPLVFVDEKLGVDEKEIKVVSDSAIMNASKYIKKIINL